MAEKKIYIGQGNKRSDNWMTATLHTEKLKDYVEEFKGTQFVRININVSDEPDEYGKDVKITVNTWKPDGGNQTSSKSDANVKQTSDNSVEEKTDDLPF